MEIDYVVIDDLRKKNEEWEEYIISELKQIRSFPRKLKKIRKKKLFRDLQDQQMLKRILS